MANMVGLTPARRESAALRIVLTSTLTRCHAQALWAFVHTSIPLAVRTGIAVAILVNTLTALIGAPSAWLRYGHRTLLCTLRAPPSETRCVAWLA